MAQRTIVQQILPDSSERRSDLNEMSLVNIERIAIDHSGSLGSLYDGYRDIIRGKLPINFLLESNVLEQLPKCLWIRGRRPESQNLLKMIEIDYELRLSIYLQMISAHGIASLINYPKKIDEKTRFLYFHQKTLTESFCDDSKDSLTSSSFGTSTTHVITEINYGIAVCIVLQLRADPVVKIASLLKRMRYSLANDKFPIDMSEQEEEDLSSQIISTTVYSNIYDLTKLNKLEDVYHRIFQLKNSQSEHRRLSYKLRPISTFYPQNSQDNLKLIPVDSSTAESLEIYLIQQLSELRVLSLRLNDDLPELLPQELNAQLEKVRRKFFEIKEQHEKTLQEIRNLLIKIRKGMSVSDSTDKLIALYSQTPTNRSIQELIISLDQLKSKSDFIENLQNSGFEYCNVDKLKIKQSYTEQLIKDILCANFSDKIMLCSSDEIRHKDESIWSEKYSEVVNKCKNNPQPSLVYADFSYSTYTLKQIMIITAGDSTTNGNESNCQPTESNVKRKSPSSTDEIINILLLGESGVGKSTFINAFANYLHFQTLNQAQQGEPVVIIPVTFLMAINDNFDQRVIKFGEVDSNENHNNSGQSVTQQCKSYVFNISNGKKLRIIDTPGFGDTRGSNQDNINMEEIFSFINNLTYLNGICLLFKPEVIQLNPYFRSCCTQLFDYFGKNIRDYFIFCFTNARSTFFAPGNTRPLLKTFFDSFPVNNIPFEKRNTFCFDSESFRYLVAKKNDIKFDNSEKNEFKQSWLRSVAESERFRDYLVGQNSFSRNDKWKSIKDAQFQINYMIRPILEGMRNLLRNIRLYDRNSSIELRPTHLKWSQVVCYTCKRTSENYGQFLILPDQLHNPSNKCASDGQKRTEYVLHYVLLDAHGDKPLADLKKQLNTLCEISAKFSYFLMKTSQRLRDDPFLTGIERMITEEKLNCQIGTSDHLNTRLTKALEQLTEKYEKQLEIIKSDGENIDLWDIYDSIKTTNEIPMVKVQLDAISKYHQYLLEKNQHTVHVNESN